MNQELYHARSHSTSVNWDPKPEQFQGYFQVENTKQIFDTEVNQSRNFRGELDFKDRATKIASNIWV